MARTDDLDALARRHLGFEALRPGQREAVEAVVGGRDTLVVMSTGSGKSAVYQLAGLVLDGPTVVVSPLIALQEDQLDYLGLGDVRAALGDPVLLALTATAAAPVRAEILELLGMRDAEVVVRGFDRPDTSGCLR